VGGGKAYLAAVDERGAKQATPPIIGTAGV
jgi:hypothetical protein